jgi:uncharacterized membrane protein
MTTENHPDPDQKKVIQLYAAFGAGLLLAVVPFFMAAFFSLIFIFGVLIAAYLMRPGISPESLIHNHATFIIRTIWIGSFIGMLTIVTGSIYLFYALDNTPLDPCIQQFMALGPETLLGDLKGMQGIFYGCYKEYASRNFMAFIISAAIAGIPVLLYFIVRYARGLSRALNGYRIAKPEAWF